MHTYVNNSVSVNSGSIFDNESKDKVKQIQYPIIWNEWTLHKRLKRKK
jgi:hypothetical protein